MAFWNDAKNKMQQAFRPRQQTENQMYSNRADGGFSGYVPRMKPRETEQMNTGYQQQGASVFANMMPEGVDPSVMQQFQPVGGQTNAMPPQQPQPGMPQQGPQPQQAPFGRGAFQQPRPQAQFQGPQHAPQFQQEAPQAARPGFGAPAFQQNQQPPRGFTAKQPPVQPQQNDAQTFAFPGGDSFVVDGNAYKLVMRVAQITGVPSCFRVIEFMYNNEAVIVNAEGVTDLVEADRCMDLIFGAACAMKQRLMRVSGKQIYLITPPQVYVAPFEALRRAGMADIDRRWPGAVQANMQPQQPVNNVQQMQQPQGFGQPRQDDFAGGFGRRAARNAMQTNGFTDYGGFGARR